MNMQESIQIDRNANGFTVRPPYNMARGDRWPETTDCFVFESEATLLQWLRDNFTSTTKDKGGAG